MKFLKEYLGSDLIEIPGDEEILCDRKSGVKACGGRTPVLIGRVVVAGLGDAAKDHAVFLVNVSAPQHHVGEPTSYLRAVRETSPRPQLTDMKAAPVADSKVRTMADSGSLCRHRDAGRTFMGGRQGKPKGNALVRSPDQVSGKR
jgi:hypothetical protein